MLPEKEVPHPERTRDSWTRRLEDADVIEARRLVATVSIVDLAKRYGVKKAAMWNAIKGISFRHLNNLYPPQQ